MKNLFLILLLTIPLCHAQPLKKTAIPSDYDSLKVIVSDLDKRQKEIKNSIDSLNGKFISDNFVTVKSTEKTQELHNVAFDKMQNSFSIFLTAVSIITGVLAILIGALGWVNFKSVNNSKEEFEKANKRILDLEKKIEMQMEIYGLDIKILSVRIANNYFHSAEQYFETAELHSKLQLKGESSDEVNILNHFYNLALYYSILYRNELELSDADLMKLKSLSRFIKKYKKEYFNYAKNFLSLFREFIDYCKKSKKREFVENAEKIWQELCGKFDKDDIDKIIEDYKRNKIKQEV
jgi:hypothetical protein